MPRWNHVTLVALVVGAVVLPAWAHHSHSNYETTEYTHLEGTVSEVHWINPHVWIHLDVEKDDGTTENWAFEAGTPNVLFRRGFTRRSLLPGTDVLVDGYQAKDGTNRANGRDITLADGTKLFLGSSGTGAPWELARPGVDTVDDPR